MTLLPTGPQYGVKYTLTGPDGTVVTFNDDTDPNNVGMLTDISGFDSPDVRENADDLVQMDGGIHGDFFYGRRPVTMTGKITSFSGDPAVRNMKMTRLMQATNALRADAVLAWTPSGSIQQQFMGLRRQQPLRITDSWIKQFQISMVAADPRVYSTTQHSQAVLASTTGGQNGFGFNLGFNIDFGGATVTGQTLVENQGNAESFPLYTITGPGTNPSIVNATTGKTLQFIYTLGSGETLVVDTLNRTVFLQAQAVDYTNLITNPSTEAAILPWANNVSGWFLVAGATLQRANSVPAAFGSWGQAPLMHAVSEGIGYNLGTLPAGTYNWSTYMRNDVGGEQVQMFGGQGNATGTTSSTIVLGSTGVWTRYSMTFTTDGTAPCFVGVRSATATLQAVWMDGMQVTAGSTLQNYVDGSQVNGRWTGATDASTSEHLYTPPGGLSRYGVLDFSNSAWGGLVPGINDIRLGYFSSSTGASLKVDWRDAWL